MLKVHNQKFDSYVWIDFEDYKFSKTALHVLVYHDDQNYIFAKNKMKLEPMSRGFLIRYANKRGHMLSYRFKFKNDGLRDACLRFLGQALKADINSRKIRLQNMLSRAL
jgi:hypothetical protein